VFVTMNGSFLEKEFLSKDLSGRKMELDEVVEPLLQPESGATQKDVSVAPTSVEEEVNDSDHETSDQVAFEPRRSTRICTTREWYGNPVLDVMLLDNDEPTSYEEAMVGPYSDKWLEALKSEIGSIYQNKVWTLVDLPDDRQAIEYKWVCKKKTDANGNITVYEARLVAKSFSQVQGVDYDEIFSPVAMLKSVGIMLALAAFFDYEIWQMDVKTRFPCQFS
jgi:hypothetical protein